MPAPSWTLPPEQERRLLFAAVGRFLTNVTGANGTLLLLDDLQWAGADALDLLASLVRLSGGQPVRVVGAYRATEVGARDLLGMLLAALGSEGLAAHIELGPLTPAEAAELLAHLLNDAATNELSTAPPDAVGVGLELADAVRKQVLRQGEGVPFFLVSCAQALRAGTLDASTGVPWTVGQSIRLRMASLPEATHELLGVAAVVGRRMARPLLLAVATRLEQGSRASLAALEAASRAGLLMEESEETLEFAHDLIREVVLADLSAARRATWHLAVAEELERLPEVARAHRTAELALHFHAGGAAARAQPYMLLAGDQAEVVYAYADAERHYRTALEVTAEAGDCTGEAEILEKLSWVLRMLGSAEALDTIDRAADIYARTGETEGELRSLAESLVIRHVHSAAAADVGMARVQPLLSALEAQAATSPGLVDVYISLSYIYSRRARFREALAAAERAEQIACALQDEERLNRAQFSRAHALKDISTRDEALVLLRAVIPMFERTGDLWRLALVLVTLCELLWTEGEFLLMESYTQQLLEVAERSGASHRMALAQAERGAYAYFVGMWSGAREHLRQHELIEQRLEHFSTSRYTTLPHTILSLLESAEGHDEAAERHIELALALGDRFDDLAFQRLARYGWAERELLAGRPAVVHAQLEPLLDRFGQQEVDATLLQPFMAWAELELGRLEQAEATVETCIARAGMRGRLALVDAYRVQAQIAIRREAWQEAKTALEAVLALTRAMPYPYAEAKALYVYGQLYAAKGEPERAQERFEQALAICDQLGEGLYRPHILHVLSAHGPQEVDHGR